AEKLLPSITEWHRQHAASEATVDPTATPLADYPKPQAQPQTLTSYRPLLKAISRYVVFTIAGVFLCLNFRLTWDPALALTSVLLVCGLVLFVSLPAIVGDRRSSRN